METLQKATHQFIGRTVQTATLWINKRGSTYTARMSERTLKVRRTAKQWRRWYGYGGQSETVVHQGTEVYAVPVPTELGVTVFAIIHPSYLTNTYLSQENMSIPIHVIEGYWSGNMLNRYNYTDAPGYQALVQRFEADRRGELMER